MVFGETGNLLFRWSCRTILSGRKIRNRVTTSSRE
jgi:hypothetical protein